MPSQKFWTKCEPHSFALFRSSSNFCFAFTPISVTALITFKTPSLIAFWILTQAVEIIWPIFDQSPSIKALIIWPVVCRRILITLTAVVIIVLIISIFVANNWPRNPKCSSKKRWIFAIVSAKKFVKILHFSLTNSVISAQFFITIIIAAIAAATAAIKGRNGASCWVSGRR